MPTLEANGLTFTYLEAGEGPLVLCLHGFPDTAHTWSHLLGRLAHGGYHAVAPFMRGYAPTEVPGDKDCHVLTLGKDALAFIEALSDGPAIVLGHDWGAMATYAAANTAPERISKLVISAIPHPRVLGFNPRVAWQVRHFVLFQWRGLAEWRVRRGDFAYIEGLYHRWSPNWDVPEYELDAVKAALSEPANLKAALWYYRDLLSNPLSRRNRELRALLRRKTEVPALLFGGDADLFSVGYFERSRTAFEPEPQVEIYEGAGHFLHRERPEAFADRVLAFLAE